MKYYINVYGCQMNINDSERLATFLNSNGLQSSNEKSADIIFVVACSVRQKAVDRIWGKIKRWIPNGKKVFITGCVLPKDRSKFFKREITYFEINDLEALGKILKLKKAPSDFLDVTPNRNPKIAYITIMTGCNNFCAYCAVPYARGREVSRPVKNIIDETKAAIDSGYKEILLLGQNVNSYQYGFDKLILKIDNLPGDFEFNFMSSNPHDMSPKIIDAFTHLKKWPRTLHLAMQSGDDEILKAMNRKYTSRQFLALVSSLKSLVPDLILTTDIIVGFPGETKTQFNNTKRLVKKIGFKKAYVSQYSPREGTASAKLKDNVLPAEKKRRWEILDQLINKSSKNSA